MSNQPKALKKGDTVAITCTASSLDKERITTAIQEIESWGLNVVVGETVGNEYLDFAGSDRMRADEFQSFLDDDSIQAILCARGGYGTARMIDLVTFENFIRAPKWICGYSDVTTLHNHLQQNFGIQTIHSVMPSGFDSTFQESIHSLKAVLFGAKMRYQFSSHSLNRKGEAKGMLVGGNLAIVHSMLGSSSQLNTDGKILFIEDVGEKLYNIDRMMVSLKRAGMLTKLSGLVTGGFTGMKGESFGKTAQEIVLEHCSSFDYPIAFDFPAGHQKHNRALLFGQDVKLTVSTPCFLDFTS